MTKKLFGAAALTALTIVGIGGCKKSDAVAVSGNLGTVDGQPISLQEYYGYLQRKPTVMASVQGRPYQVSLASSLGSQAAHDLIQAKLLMQVAKEEGVVPSKEDVEKELNFRKRQNANYIQNLERTGLSLDEIRNEVQLELAKERLQTKGVVVTQDEAKKFIESNKTTFSTPAQAKLLIIAVNSPKLKSQVDSDLKGGQNFAAVAMHYSISPQARQNGGAFALTNVSQMPPWLQKMISATPERKSTAWHEDGQGNSFKFYVESKTAAKPLPVDANLIEEVQRELALRKSTNGPQLDKKFADKIKSATVQLSVPAYQDAWKQYQEQAKAAPANPSSAPSGAVQPRRKG